MKFQYVISKINDILTYPQRRRKKRLYQQWVDRAGLPPEAVPEEEKATDKITIPKIDKDKLGKRAPYLLLVALAVIIIVLLIILIINSC